MQSRCNRGKGLHGLVHMTEDGTVEVEGEEEVIWGNNEMGRGRKRPATIMNAQSWHDDVMCCGL